MINLFNKSKKSSQYKFYKIYWHPKYNGTFMLFGWNIKQQRMLLLEQSELPPSSTGWDVDYDCEAPDMKNQADNALLVFGF